MALYEVTVCIRGEGYSARTFSIEAETEQEAKTRAVALYKDMVTVTDVRTVRG